MRDTINTNTDQSIAKKLVSLKDTGDEGMDLKKPAIGKDIIYDVANFTETSIEDKLKLDLYKFDNVNKFKDGKQSYSSLIRQFTEFLTQVTDKLPGNNLIVYLWSWGQELKCYNHLMDLEMKQNLLEDDTIKY